MCSYRSPSAARAERVMAAAQAGAREQSGCVSLDFARSWMTRSFHGRTALGMARLRSPPISDPRASPPIRRRSNLCWCANPRSELPQRRGDVCPTRVLRSRHRPRRLSPATPRIRERRRPRPAPASSRSAAGPCPFSCTGMACGGGAADTVFTVGNPSEPTSGDWVGQSLRSTRCVRPRGSRQASRAPPPMPSRCSSASSAPGQASGQPDAIGSWSWPRIGARTGSCAGWRRCWRWPPASAR